jgi:hypothetical protein
MCHMTRSQRAKVGGGAYWSSSAHKDRWTRHADTSAIEDRWIRHVEQASDSGRRWSRRVASLIGHRAAAANSLGDGSIMVLGGQSFRPFVLVGTQGMKAPTQMDSACDNPDTQVMCQGDARFRPKPGDMKVSGTSHKVDSATFLFGTNSALIVTWGNFGQYSSLQGKILFVVLVSHFRPPYCLGRSLTFVFQFFSLQSFWAPPRFSLNFSYPRPLPCFRSAQNLTQWPQLTLLISFQCFGAPPRLALKHLTPRTLSRLCSAQNFFQWLLLILDPPILSPLHIIPNSLQPCGPLSRLDNSRRTQSASTLVDMQGGKGLFVGSGQLDPEEECMGCQRTRIQMGALSSTLTFELETLSQHRHLIERLQDESYAQRSQIEEQRSSMEIMQRRLDQLE